MVYRFFLHMLRSIDKIGKKQKLNRMHLQASQGHPIVAETQIEL